MIIRKVTLEDRESWEQMRNQLWPDLIEQHRKEIQKFFDGKQFDISEVFVLDLPVNKLRGFIELNIRNFAEGSSSDRVPYVEGWFVDASERGKGFGKQLMIAAEEWARELGCDELASDVEMKNDVSIAAHTALGFEETCRVVCFLKKLKSD